MDSNFIVFSVHVQCRECFGEGLHWAGCSFIVLLGQQKKFEAVDFCYHLMRVHEVDRQGDIVSGVVSHRSFVAVLFFSMPMCFCAISSHLPLSLSPPTLPLSLLLLFLFHTLFLSLSLYYFTSLLLSNLPHLLQCVIYTYVHVTHYA